IRLVTTVGEFVESPEINIEGEIAHYIYDEGINSSAWDLWGGWGLEVQDVANTEQPKRGSNDVKLVFNDSWGAFQQHTKTADVLEYYNGVVAYIYGTIEGSNRDIVIVSLKNQVVSTAGEYTTFEIPLSQFGDLSEVAEFLIKNFRTNPKTVYVDLLG